MNNERKDDEIDIIDSSKQNIIKYAVETFTRAFPSCYDGLKPIHRRILFNMYVERIYSYTKVSKIVGSTMGNFHPHGDSSIEGALVRMGEPWVMNYPYIDGSGNFGTQDGDEASASRYIEAKLSDFSKEAFLNDLDDVSVNYEPNFDYTRNIPQYFAARIPLVLINGVTGIGEAYKVDIPPHNLYDVVNVCKKYILNKEIKNEELCEGLFPDFPTGGEILNGSEIEKFYKFGESTSISVRGKAKLIPETNTISLIEFPWGVAINSIVSDIQKEIKNGNMIFQGIESLVDINIHDDSLVDSSGALRSGKKDNKGKGNFECTCRKDANIIEILNEIYRVTQFQTNIPLSFMINCDGFPVKSTIKNIIEMWYSVRYDYKRRKYTTAIAKAHSKKHVMLGLISVYDRMDDIIKTIKENTSDKDSLIRKLHDEFNLSMVQAKGIYEMSLGQLSRFGHSSLENIVQNLSNEIENNTYNLNHIDEIIIEELEDLAKKFGRERMTKVSMKVSYSSKKITISKGAFLYSKGSIGLYDANGVKNSKNIVTGLKSLKKDNKFVKDEIIGGFSIEDKTPIAFIVCYEGGFINRIDVDVFKVLNVWFSLDCGYNITCATPIYDEEDVIVSISSDMKLKRFKANEINGKRLVSCGQDVIYIISYSLKDEKKSKGHLFCIDEESNYTRYSINDIPLLSKNALGVKTPFTENSDKVKMLICDSSSGESDYLVISYTDVSLDNQNYILNVPLYDIPISLRSGKAKRINIPHSYRMNNVFALDISKLKDKQICLIGKNSTSTLNANNFKKVYEPKRLFIPVNAAVVL